MTIGIERAVSSRQIKMFNSEKSCIGQIEIEQLTFTRFLAGGNTMARSCSCCLDTGSQTSP